VNIIDTFKESHHNATGVNFDLKTIEEQDLAWSGRPDDDGEEFTRTDFYATGFSFTYKGAVISGRLPDAYAGFSENLRLGDTKYEDLLPAVIKACSFPLDLSQVGGC
jgi:hypothetical protein